MNFRSKTKKEFGAVLNKWKESINVQLKAVKNGTEAQHLYYNM